MTAAHIDDQTGKTSVTYVLHDNPAGFTAKTLTNNGTIKDLSLHHKFFPDSGKVEPVEVSLCAQGARKGTHIYKDSKKSLNKKAAFASVPLQSTLAAHQTPISVAMSDPTPAAAPVEQQQPASSPTTEEPAAATKTVAEEPKKTSDLSESSNQDFLELIGEHVKDPAMLNELYNRVGQLMKYGCAQGEAAKELKIKLDALEAANKKITENNAQTAEQMIAVMNDLYRRFSPDCVQGEDCVKEASKELGENPNLMNMLRGVPIMASAISISTSRSNTVAQEQHTANVAMQKELQNSKATVAMYEKQIGSMQGFTSDPLWEPAAKPVVSVAASAGTIAGGGNKRHRTDSLVPEWLRNQCGDYQEANFNQQKVFTNDFADPVRAYGRS